MARWDLQFHLAIFNIKGLYIMINNEWSTEFRPSNWDGVIGNVHIKSLIMSALQNDNFPKFSIFSGPSGTGKSCIAELIARTISCENSNVEPCNKCESCKMSVDGMNPAIRKYNMAKMLGKKDILTVLEEIFTFESIMPNTVYILEEVHGLSDRDQLPFLEELTKIPNDVYIIMCTTQEWKLIPEIKNRAISFIINNPTTKECMAYIDTICTKKRLPILLPQTKSTFCQLCGNTPRKIINTLQLFSTNPNLTQKDLIEFFGIASDAEYITLLENLSPSVSVFEFANFIENNVVSNLKLVKGLDNFIIKTILESGGKKSFSSFNNPEKIREVIASLGNNVILNIAQAVEDIPPKAYTTETNAKLALVKMKMKLSNKYSSITRDNNNLATQSIIASSNKAVKHTDLTAGTSRIASSSSLKSLSDADLMASLDIVVEE